jgi:hypothetical protein
VWPNVHYQLPASLAPPLPRQYLPSPAFLRAAADFAVGSAPTMRDMSLILRQNFFLKYGKACFCIHDDTEKRITGYTSIQNAAFLYPRKHDKTTRINNDLTFSLKSYIQKYD